eukprot:PhM_4_TR4581/c0_g1_i1/m.99022
MSAGNLLNPGRHGFRVIEGFLKDAATINQWKEFATRMYTPRRDDFIRPITDVHYSLQRNPRNNYVPSTKISFRIVRKKKKASKKKKDEDSKAMAEKLFRMAQQVTARLDSASKDPMEITERLFRDVGFRQTLGQREANVWMGAPREALPLYTESVHHNVTNLFGAEASAPPHLRLSGDRFMLREACGRPLGFQTSLPHFCNEVDWATLATDAPMAVVWVFLSDHSALQGGVHVMPESHQILCDEGRTSRVTVKALGELPFLPMESHVTNLFEKVPTIAQKTEPVALEVKAGTALVMHPAMVYGLGVNMDPAAMDAVSLQLLVMKDGCKASPLGVAPYNWYSSWQTNLLKPVVLDQKHLFPTILG